MKNVVIEAKDDVSIGHIIRLVMQSFSVSEKNFYAEKELKIARTSLTSFDVFDKKTLTKQVLRGEVKVFICIGKGRIVGVSAVEVKTGRIYYLCATNGASLEYVAKDLLDKIIEERVDNAKPWIDIMAFVGQLENLKQLGFRKLYDTVINYQGIKFIPMRYDYTQLDIEK